MMYKTVGALFKDTCDAIREKDGTTALIPHQQIPDRIRAIHMGEGGGGDVVASSFPSAFYTYSGDGLKLENMVASNFQSQYGIFFGEPFLPGNSPWEIGVKFTWPKTLVKHANVLFGCWLNYYYCPSLEIGSDRNINKVVALVPDGATNAWNHQGTYMATPTLGADYWVKFKFDGEKYVVSLSDDGKTFEDIIQIDYGVMAQNWGNNCKLQFGGICRSSNHCFEGTIDLKETYIKIGDEIWWGAGEGNGR
ncbi:MAG: hypothetical protein NC430_12220 [bacterium]|nr:hypothetical protein [bacterium]